MEECLFSRKIQEYRAVARMSGGADVSYGGLGEAHASKDGNRRLQDLLAACAASLGVLLRSLWHTLLHHGRFMTDRSVKLSEASVTCGWASVKAPCALACIRDQRPRMSS